MAAPVLIVAGDQADIYGMSVLSTSVAVAGASSLGTANLSGTSARVAEAQQSALQQAQTDFARGLNTNDSVTLSHTAQRYVSRGEGKKTDSSKQSGESGGRLSNKEKSASGDGPKAKLNVVA